MITTNGSRAFFYADGIPTKGLWLDIDSLTDWDGIKAALAHGGYIPTDEDGEPDYDGDILVADAEGLAKCFTGSNDIFDLDGFTECEDANGDTDAKIAYMDIFGDWDGDRFDETYRGTWDSDEDFARELAEEIGAINREVNWPYTCIDWEWAAREIMYDYCESDGHYFSNY